MPNAVLDTVDLMAKPGTTKLRAVLRTPNRYRVQVLERALAILDVLAETQGDYGPAELSRRLSLHKSTIHRLLFVLQEHGFVRSVNGRYSLGMRLFELGSRAVARIDVRQYAHPFLSRLVDQTGETAHLAVLLGSEMVSILNVQSPKKLRTPVTVGGRTPLHCTSVGKAVLAFMPDAERHRIMSGLTFPRFTRKTLVSRAALAAELVRTRGRGYALDNEEIEEGMRCLGVPIHDYSGRVVGAISIAGPTFRVTTRRVPELARAVLAAGEELSATLGYRADSPVIHGGMPRQ
jgi:DNA-binding IclR family transcriptional regulator